MVKNCLKESNVLHCVFCNFKIVFFVKTLDTPPPHQLWYLMMSKVRAAFTCILIMSRAAPRFAGQAYFAEVIYVDRHGAAMFIERLEAKRMRSMLPAVQRRPHWSLLSCAKKSRSPSLNRRVHGLWERDCQLFYCWFGSLG